MDAVRPVTRIVAMVLVPLLAYAAAALYLWPGETERLFAWTIKPDATPMLMGAGYASGVVFFSFVARARRWHEVSFGFVGIAVFATMMGKATILHWDKFNHDHLTFYGWVTLYAVAPLLIPLLWLYNGGWRPGPVEQPDVEVPRLARIALGVAGVSLFVVAIAIFVRPSIAIEHWPWDVTPLTARVVASFTALNVGWAAAALDRRWSSLRIPAISQLTNFVLLLVALVVTWDDIHTDRVGTWLYIGALAGLAAFLAWLLVAMSLRRSASEPLRD